MFGYNSIRGEFVMAYDRIIFHIDVNSAYLAWEAVYRLQHGETIDLRNVPSVVGGNPETRHGIVLAKSIPAKKYKILTGETIIQAVMKCPDLVIVPPRYDRYIQASAAMVKILEQYSPKIQRYSIDEVFLDYTNMECHFGDPVTAAHRIKDHIKDELGFTVNIGISTNKLLAKMAGDFEKPDKVHTLFPHEIKEKMWPLPVEKLFMCGSKTTPKLRKRGIYTIGDLANTDVSLIRYWLKSHGVMLWNYAHGREYSNVSSDGMPMKGIGNSCTTPTDLKDIESMKLYILSLSEMVAMRLRDAQKCANVLCVSLRDTSFNNYSHQKKMEVATDSTMVIYNTACQLLEKMWKGEAIRHIGLRASELQSNNSYQTSIFYPKLERERTLDKAVDKIREKYGSMAIMRTSILGSGLPPVMGGVPSDEENQFPMMSSIL